VEEDCVFCQIVAGERRADIVYEDDLVVAFKDINPHAPVHILLVPRRHVRSVNDLTEGDRDVLGGLIMGARGVARKMGIDRSGYKLVFNVERGGGQLIFHLHLHLIGGWRRIVNG
jgi:histidine triad (HIT) family protein